MFVASVDKITDYLLRGNVKREIFSMNMAILCLFRVLLIKEFLLSPETQSATSAAWKG